MPKDLNKEDILIFGLSSNKPLTKRICDVIGVEEAKVVINKFADNEILVKAGQTVRNKEIYIIQPTSEPVNDHLVELLIAIDAFKRASAAKINVIIPYFGYARQDRKSEGRQPISARLVANLIETAGANRVLVVDLHSAQTMGFFNIPVDNFSTSLTLANEIVETIINEKLDSKKCILVSPDYGGLKRVHDIKKFCNELIPSIAVIAKQRIKPNEAEVEFVLGDIEGKTCFIVDDMIDTGGTIIAACEALKNKGAQNIYILASHGLFNREAPQKMQQACEKGIIKAVIVTDTINILDSKKFKGLKIISVDNLIGQMILASYRNESLSVVYENRRSYIDEKIKKYLNKGK